MQKLPGCMNYVIYHYCVHISYPPCLCNTRPSTYMRIHALTLTPLLTLQLLSAALTHSFTHSLLHSLTFTHSLLHTLTPSHTHSFTHSLLHTITSSHTHSFTHPPAPLCCELGCQLSPSQWVAIWPQEHGGAPEETQLKEDGGGGVRGEGSACVKDECVCSEGEGGGHMSAKVCEGEVYEYVSVPAHV